MDEPWFIQLFGGLRATLGERTVSRFRTQKTGSLLAYLAYHQGRSHSRETLIELLWPDSEPDSGRHNLSLALSSLRSQLELPGVPDGAVIVADRHSVELNPDAFTTDVDAFEQAVRRALQARNAPDRVELLAEAVDAYGGDLLPGYYEDWVLVEQRRLAERCAQTAVQLVGLLEREGDGQRALNYALQAAKLVPLHDEVERELIRLLAAHGDLDAALRQYREYARLCAERHGEPPSPPTAQLARQIEARLSAVQVPAPALAGAAPAPVAAPLPAGLPTGTVTFLFTDVEGSTAMWEREGEAFRRALSVHHALLRREFRRFGGVEAKEAGDSFLVAFASVSDALACAVACQRALAAQEWAPADRAEGSGFRLRVRIALNTGDVELEDGEYHGLPLHRCARILSAAHGGQILCSEGASALLRRDLEQDIRLQDLGLYRLRGVEEPERLFQVNYPGIETQEFPPLLAEPARQAHLPLQFTRFFGREAEIEQLVSRLSPSSSGANRCRVVTLTGPGGTGKTRLAIETAGRLADAFEGAVWFVPLAEVSDPRLLLGAILDALSIPRSSAEKPAEQVASALSRQASLLVLDNLEQLVDIQNEAGHDVDAVGSLQLLLEQVPGLTCLFTSRQRLGLPGEQEFPVPPLSTPSRLGGPSPERLSAYESVRLFLDRAQAVKPDFRITNQNAPAVAELCDRLEGLPLAIELAAARALVMTPTQMLAQLANRFEFLVSSSRKRGVSERQRTLRATIDWSYRLLAPDLQRFFAKLSAFRGGWTVEAAEEVCDEPLALDFLAQLREGSLVLTEERAGTMRCRFLEMLREYAADRMAQLGEGEAEALHERHARFFVRLAREAEPRLVGADQAEWLERLEAEHDNFRAALSWCAASESPDVCRSGLELGSALWRFWSVRGHAREGRRHLDALLGQRSRIQSSDSERTEAEALNAVGALAHDMSDYEGAAAALERSLAFWRASGDKAPLAHALNLMGNVRLDQGRDANAVPLYEEALGLYRELADRRGTAMVLSNLGALAVLRGEPKVAEPLLEESLTIKRTLGSRYSVAIGLENLGNVERSLGRFDRAIELHEEALAIRRDLGHRAGIAMSCSNLGQAIVQRGDADLSPASSYLREALEAFHELGDAKGLAECIVTCAAFAASTGQSDVGARLVGAAIALRRGNGIELTAGDLAFEAKLVSVVQRTANTEFDSLNRAGGRMSVEEAVESARSVVGSNDT